jgi:hypothetical protein
LYGKIGNPARNLVRLFRGCEAPQRLRTSDAAGSNPTTSKATLELLTERLSQPAHTLSTPELPGPPGFANTEPNRFAGSDAGIRANAICVVAAGFGTIVFPTGRPETVPIGRRSTGS